MTRRYNVGGIADHDVMASRTLTELEHRILGFEARWEGRAGTKSADVLQEFGWSATAYEQKLNWLIDLPAAEVAEPALIHRLFERRERRVQRRIEHRLA